MVGADGRALDGLHSVEGEVVEKPGSPNEPDVTPRGVARGVRGVGLADVVDAPREPFTSLVTAKPAWTTASRMAAWSGQTGVLWMDSIRWRVKW